MAGHVYPVVLAKAGTQYAQPFGSITDASEYWATRFRGR